MLSTRALDARYSSWDSFIRIPFCMSETRGSFARTKQRQCPTIRFLSLAAVPSDHPLAVAGDRRSSAPPISSLIVPCQHRPTTVRPSAPRHSTVFRYTRALQTVVTLHFVRRSPVENRRAHTILIPYATLQFLPRSPVENRWAHAIYTNTQSSQVSRDFSVHSCIQQCES